jgi:hypothetical protein
VLNPSFEDTVACPNSNGMPQDAQGWSSFGNSPDYCNTCASNSSYASVPYNMWGYQQAATGKAYMGIQCRFTPGYREFLGRQLLSPLIIGTKYFVSFKVNCAFGGAGGASCGCNKTGVLFSTIPYTTSNIAPINNFAHVYTDSIIVDTLNWTTISGSFVADSAYNFAIVGNFFDDAHTSIQQIIPPSGSRAIYYIDDICITTDSAQGCDFTTGIKNHFAQKPVSIYPNPASNILNVRLNTSVASSVRIVDFSLRTVYAEKNITSKNEIITIDLSPYPQGLYFIEVTTSEKTWTEKFIINP